MSQKKRPKMDPGAACSSASVNTQELSTSVLGGGDEPHIPRQTARADRTTNENVIFDESRFEFREAVKWTGFVDRSLLIKELLIKPLIVIIFAPKRFGKSMNLDMVKCFFEIEKGRDVTKEPQDLKDLEKFENYKAFNRYGSGQCKILKEEVLVKEYFGRHPVLHMDFKNVKVSSIQKVEDSLRSLVHLAYLAHSYLKNGEIFPDPSDNEEANNTCRVWCHTEKYMKQSAIVGLQLLVQYLHAYHKRKVYVLLDEFDAPAVKALLKGKSGDEVSNISSEVTELIGSVVKDSTLSKSLLGSLITGVSYLGSIGISQDLNNVPFYKWLLDSDGRFTPYYGLSHEELETLIDHVFPNQKKEERNSMVTEVKKLYNGYNFGDKPLYCLWSVLHYIRMRTRLNPSEITKRSFWGGSSIISEMGSLLKNSTIMEEIITLMGDNHISFLPCEKVNAKTLADFLKGESMNLNIVFSFLMEQGYLTRVSDKSYNVCDPNTEMSEVVSEMSEITVKIPNTDVLIGFQQMLNNFFVNVCGLDGLIMTKCAEVFKDLPKDRNDGIFKTKLKDFYKHLEALLHKFDGQKLNERSLQAALYTTMLKRGFIECYMEKYVNVDSDFGKIDLWLFNGDFAVIFEFKFIESDDEDLHKKSAQQALKEILFVSENKKVPYVKILDLEEYSNTKNYLLIGISMSGKGKPYMCCVINDNKNQKDWIFFP